MDKKKYWIIRLFFVLFTISVSVAMDREDITQLRDYLRTVLEV